MLINSSTESSWLSGYSAAAAGIAAPTSVALTNAAFPVISARLVQQAAVAGECTELRSIRREASGRPGRQHVEVFS